MKAVAQFAAMAKANQSLQGCWSWCGCVRADEEEAEQARRLGDFPQTERLWEGGDFKFCGSAIRYKKILFISIQIYEVALYLEVESTTAELKRLKAAGFFAEAGFTEARLIEALGQCCSRRTLQIQMLRSASYSQFSSEMKKDLEPRLARTGDQALLEPFLEFFKDKPLSNGSTILSIWESDQASLEGSLFPPGFTDYQDAHVPVGLVNENFCRAMFDLYWGPDCVVPDARRQWAEAAMELLKA